MGNGVNVPCIVEGKDVLMAALASSFFLSACRGSSLKGADAGIGGNDPVGVQVSHTTIKDNHTARTATNADVCAAMNGCPP